MILRDDAIVLKRQNWSETSRIVHVLSRRGGRLKLVAKGSRKLKSRFGASFEPGTLAQVVYYASRSSDLHTASEAAVLWRPRCEDFDGSLLRSVALELAYKAAPVETPNLALFRNLLGFLQATGGPADGSHHTRLVAFFLLALNNLGYDPGLDRCLSCGKAASAALPWFSAVNGGLVCAPCGRRLSGTVALDGAQSSALRLWRDRRALPDLDPACAKRLLEVLTSFLNHHVSGRSRLACVRYL